MWPPGEEQIKGGAPSSPGPQTPHMRPKSLLPVDGPVWQLGPGLVRAPGRKLQAWVGKQWPPGAEFTLAWRWAPLALLDH